MDSKEFPEIESIMDLDMAPNGRASLLNRYMVIICKSNTELPLIYSLAVDYEKYPALTRVKKFHIAILGPGMLVCLVFIFRA